MFVVHPSLLPKYRGATPVHHALFHDETETGVTIVDTSIDKFDAGKVFLKEKISIERNETYKELREKLADLGGVLANQLIDGGYSKKDPAEQDHSKATPAPLLLKDANLFRISGSTYGHPTNVRNVYCMHRGFSGSSFKALKFQMGQDFIFVDECRPLVLSSGPEDYKLDEKAMEYLWRVHSFLKPGNFFYFNNIKQIKNCVAVRLEDGFLIVSKMHFTGGSVMSGKQFIEKHLSSPHYSDFIASMKQGEPNSELSSKLLKIE